MNYSNYYPASGLFHASLPLVMGTRMDALLFGDDSRQLENVWEQLEKELRLLEKMLNRFDPASETAKVNTLASLSAVRLTEELWHILLDCRHYHEGTDGYFDITCSDFNKIVFMEETHSIFFDKPGMMLDFGGYGKGYALKCMREQLKVGGIKRALISFGNSSILALGGHPHGDSWPIGLESLTQGNDLPPSHASSTNAVSKWLVHLLDTSLSVSGNSPARKEHIVNPKTSQRIAGEQMVAIVAEDPVDAEALTTAWIASGSYDPPDWMLNYNLIKKIRIK